MNLEGRSTGWKDDIRDSCGVLTLHAKSDDDVAVLTRLYRWYSGCERPAAVEAVIRELEKPTERYTLSPPVRGR